MRSKLTIVGLLFVCLTHTIGLCFATYGQNTFDNADKLISANVRYGQGADSTPHITETFQYDLNGALTNWISNTNGLSCTYDAMGRLASYFPFIDEGVPAGGGSSCAYDALGNRIRMGAKLFIPDHSDPLKRPLMECDSNGNIIRYYIWGDNRLLGYISSDGILAVVHSDDYSNVIGITDISGNVLYSANYSPHGADWGSTGHNPTPFTWLGGYGVQTLETDTPLRLYLTRHRLYSATLNRFLSSDPLGLDGGLNLYAYGNGNPLAYIDPLGLYGLGDFFNDTGNFFKGVGDFATNLIPGAINGLQTFGLWTMEAIANPGRIPGDLRDGFNSTVENTKEAWKSGPRGKGQVVASTAFTVGTVALPFMKAAPATPARQNVFWSGGATAENAAKTFAKANNGVVIGDTAAGQAIIRAEQAGLPWTQSKPLWITASENFARTASGEVNVFQSAHGIALDSIWLNEWRILMQNPNVSTIIYHVVMPDGTIIKVGP